MKFGQFLRLIPELRVADKGISRHVNYLTHLNSVRKIHSSRKANFLFDKMAAVPGEKRVLVHLKNKDTDTYHKGNFTECIIDYIDANNSNGVCEGVVELKDNKLHISPSVKGSKSSAKMKHPPFCPIHHLTEEIQSALPADILSRGIDCGAAVILESGDGLVFLTRRGDNLRTFPGIWVPPGGHIEQNETLHEAGLRELQEETGLTITTDMCDNKQVNVIAVWESVFPPKLTLGQPKRHHAVIYLHAKLKPEFTAEHFKSKVTLCRTEVGACAWFDKSQVGYIVAAKEDAEAQIVPDNVLSGLFSAIFLNDNKEQCDVMLPFRDLLKTAGDTSDQKGRVSTGTKFALEEWLEKKQ